MSEPLWRLAVNFPQASWLEPARPRARWVLRGDASVRALAGKAFGVALPEDVCRAGQAGEFAALWLGPDEQLLLAPVEAHRSSGEALRVALADNAHSLVDVSHRQVGFGVTGPRAEWLLEAQCPLPLNLRDFPVGMCTRTVFGKAEIVLWRNRAQSFHVEAWRSFAPYVVALLGEAAQEPGANVAQT